MHIEPEAGIHIPWEVFAKHVQRRVRRFMLRSSGKARYKPAFSISDESVCQRSDCIHPAGQRFRADDGTEHFRQTDAPALRRSGTTGAASSDGCYAGLGHDSSEYGFAGQKLERSRFDDFGPHSGHAACAKLSNSQSVQFDHQIISSFVSFLSPWPGSEDVARTDRKSVV